MLAAMTESADITNEVILKCQDKGLILFWLLFEANAIRITPPLTISEDEIREGCAIMIEVMNEIMIWDFWLKLIFEIAIAIENLVN